MGYFGPLVFVERDGLSASIGIHWTRALVTRIWVLASVECDSVRRACIESRRMFLIDVEAWITQPNFPFCIGARCLCLSGARCVAANAVSHGDLAASVGMAAVVRHGAQRG
jgi:hypothetical protein